MKPSGPGFCLFVGKFLITESISYLLLVYADFLFLHKSVLVDFLFLGIYLFLLCSLICWNIIVNSSSWDLLYFYGINYNVSSFISGFIYGPTLFDCSLLYHTLQILHFYKLMLWQPWAKQVCQYHCSNIICSLGK